MSHVLAYLDPGSSSMILQMLLGGVAAAGVAMKLYWRRLLRLLRIRKDDPADEVKGTAPAATATANGQANGQTTAERESVGTVAK